MRRGVLLVEESRWHSRANLQASRAARRAFHPRVGTALASALLVGSLFVCSPAFPQSIVVIQTVTDLIQSNTAVVNGAPTTDISQINAVPDLIDINNSAPATGILAAITVTDVTQSNSSTVSNTQSATVNQLNTVDSNIAIVNSGPVVADDIGISAAITLNGIHQSNVSTVNNAQSATVNQLNAINSNINIDNSGIVRAGNIGIFAAISLTDITQSNSSSTANVQSPAISQGNTVNSNIAIVNSGDVWGGNIGIVAQNTLPFGSATTTIVNTGSISAGSLFAIDTVGASTLITNSGGGVITGFVDLTDNPDTFNNGAGGTFEARGESNFRDGFDVFNNDGGIVHALGNTSLVNLEEFNNSGLISMVDGKPRDVFVIDGPVAFNALSGSALDVDAKLGRSKADLLVIDGNVEGKTAVSLNNVSPGGGAFNKAGIPVVEVTGSVGPKDFVLKGGPVDTGFFRYDLFFEPGDTNVFELRSALNQNAFVLPQLTTAMQDLWHSTSDTWFDRTADLRMALYGAPAMALPASSKLEPVGPAPGYQAISPGLWARGSFGELNRDASVSFTSFGPATAHLNREQRTGDFEVGADFGVRDLLGQGDALIFGVLGGFVVSELDYDQLAQSFDLNGGQVGAYATYLNGGLFLDTLFKADFVNLDPKSTIGFAGSLDAQNFGVRLDSGYRFGGFGPGMFFEPLATIGVVDSEIDNFTQGANRVNFDDGTSVRGRLGLRVGTNFQAGQITVEPFVIGSVWHEFEDDNRTTLVSSGTLFSLTDNFQDTWGEVSAGLNLFNLGAGASGFGKVDVAFGDDIDGVGGQVGVRYRW